MDLDGSILMLGVKHCWMQFTLGPFFLGKELDLAQGEWVEVGMSKKMSDT